MKKFLSGLATGIFIMSIPTAFAIVKGFKDVRGDAWFYTAVANLNEKGIITGYSDGTFQPNSKPNRAEIAVMMNRLLEYMEHGKVDSRELISSLTNYSQKQIIQKFLGEAWNIDLASISTIYQNSEKGIEISLPFNPFWGTKNYRINPFEVNGNEVRFGTMMVCGEGAGCLAREYRLTFRPAKTLDQEVQEISALEGGTMKIKTMNVGDMSVVEYFGEPGLCTMSELVVIGKKSNYVFSSPCGLSDEQVESLKKVIESIKFL